MMLATSPFTASIKAGAEIGKKFDDLSREMADMMERICGHKMRVEFDHSLGYVLIIRK